MAEVKRRLKAGWSTLRSRLFAADRSGRIGKRVIFVAGVQRSGTNMFLKVLDGSSGTDVYREGDPRAFDDYEMRSLSVIRGLVERSGYPVVVVKALCESDRLRALLDSFDNSRAVWLVRSYPDVINSQQRLWDDQVEVLQRIVSNRYGLDWQGRGMSDATYEMVRELYHPEITQASAWALFWYWRNLSFFEQKLHEDPRVLPVHYEFLVRNPRAGFERIFEFLGIPFEERAVAGVSARSVGKEAAPDVEPRIRALCDEMQDRLSGYGLDANDRRGAVLSEDVPGGKVEKSA